jgi:hypothetical protein
MIFCLYKSGRKNELRYSKEQYLFSRKTQGYSYLMVYCYWDIVICDIMILEYREKKN